VNAEGWRKIDAESLTMELFVLWAQDYKMKEAEGECCGKGMNEG
jgi:hypothetical protein